MYSNYVKTLHCARTYKCFAKTCQRLHANLCFSLCKGSCPYSVSLLLQPYNKNRYVLHLWRLYVTIYLYSLLYKKVRQLKRAVPLKYKYTICNYLKMLLFRFQLMEQWKDQRKNYNCKKCKYNQAVTNKKHVLPICQT